MMTPQQIQNILMEALPVRKVGAGVRIPTHCLYPTGQHVVLYLAKGQDERFTLTDDGQALSVVSDTGLNLSKRQVTKTSETAAAFGSSFAGGSFTVQGIDAGQIPAAVFALANLVQSWASDLILEHEAAKEIQLKERVQEKLEHIFAPTSLDREFKILGESNTSYSFDYRVKLVSDRYMLIDVINNHGIAIASAFKRNYDVKKASNENYIQEGIIENQKSWKGEDLNLLHDVLDGIVPFESNLQALQKYAAG